MKLVNIRYYEQTMPGQVEENMRGRLLAEFGTDIAPSLLFGSSTAAQVAEAIREQIAVRALIAADAEAAPDDDDAEMEVLTL